ncbi:L-serine ammonia-lyase, iron-sulfur-dependent, subunit beta [Heliobacterium gestii]|uniref:L-serine deaminase n=1 Tax=Heliomicrobium gestii TaxID=2699 RepID=A0A845L6Q5_HELGE|nr:L-serine ammonia-lyase, iron-sulfur-dependent subunit beta [Heliomicrobium gestii]MBM7866874.1 L-serine dehydratase [Heliomicrobium gestii]MZP42302.1 L-serine ammonia-lyase, iron-sulfur-dependent, subunit beta [Heliomicrobium gestii]
MNIFDVIGPVMIGPSSSHTAGAVRLGNVARLILGEAVMEARIGLHGSFAETHRGHGTDRALVAGLLGWATDDLRIPNSFEFAETAGLAVTFSDINLGELAHPNSVRFNLIGQAGTRSDVTGASIGGGRVQVTRVDDFPVELTGDFATLLVTHHDQPGVISLVTAVLGQQGINIAQMRVSREQKGARALMVLETDQTVTDEALRAIAALPPVERARRIQID